MPFKPHIMSMPQRISERQNPEQHGLDQLSSEGVYIGQAKAVIGSALAPVFNVFVLPEDLQVDGQRALLTYDATQALFAEAKDVHGHDTAAFDEQALIKAMLEADGPYQGQWVLPPRGVHAATDANGRPQAASIQAHCEKGALRSTFGMAVGSVDRDNNDHPERYLSSTLEGGRVFTLNLHPRVNHQGSWDNTHVTRAACRPVRFVRA